MLWGGRHVCLSVCLSVCQNVSTVHSNRRNFNIKQAVCCVAHLDTYIYQSKLLSIFKSVLAAIWCPAWGWAMQKGVCTLHQLRRRELKLTRPDRVGQTRHGRGKTWGVCAKAGLVCPATRAGDLAAARSALGCTDYTVMFQTKPKMRFPQFGQKLAPTHGFSRDLVSQGRKE